MPKSLADVIRHEYGHAVAHTHGRLVRSSRFREAFGASHDSLHEFEYDEELHVTPYAATSAAEDFAETFMFYLRHGGRLPAGFKPQGSTYFDTSRTTTSICEILRSPGGSGRPSTRIVSPGMSTSLPSASSNNLLRRFTPSSSGTRLM